MTTFSRYTNLYYHFARQSLIRELQYRTDWIFTVFNTLAWSFLRLLYYILAFSAVTTVGDWDYTRSLILVGTFMIVHAIYKVMFEANFERLISQIYTGELDHLVTKPVSSQFIVSTRIFTPRALIRLILGIGIIVYAIWSSDFSPTNYQTSLFLLMLVNGISIMYSFGFIILSTAFWLGYVDPLSHVPQSLTGMSYLPYDIFPRPVNELITFVIPLIFIATIPAQTLFNPQPTTILLGLTLSAIFLILTKIVWQAGLRTYSSASS